MRMFSSAPVGFCLSSHPVEGAVSLAFQPRVRVRLEAIGENAIVLASPDQRLEQRLAWQPILSLRHALPLPAAVFNAVHRQFGLPLSAFYLSYQLPVGKSLTPGVACAAALAMVEAFALWLRLPMSQAARVTMAVEAVQALGLPSSIAYPLVFASAQGGVLLVRPGVPVLADPIPVSAALRLQLETDLMLWHLPATGADATTFNMAPASGGVSPMSVVEALLKIRLEDLSDLLRPQADAAFGPDAPPMLGWLADLPAAAWRTDYGVAPTWLLAMPDERKRATLTAYMSNFGAYRLQEGISLQGAEAVIG